MKVDNLEQFKLEVKKALLARDTNAVVEYQLSTFQFFESTKSWMIRENGLLHCEWGPAVIMSDGTQGWYFMELLHRIDGPAIIRPDGSEEWWYMGYKHRINGPAVIYPDGTEEWYFMGRLHRNDGPAIIRPRGFNEYWCMGRRIYTGGSNESNKS